MDENVINQKLDQLLKEVTELKIDQKLANERFQLHCSHLEQCKRHWDLIYGNGQLGIKEIVSSHIKEHQEAKSQNRYSWILGTGIATAIATFIQGAIAYFNKP